MENNQKIYSTKDILKEYTSHQYIQKGEQNIFELFGDKLANGKVLDVGIGAGRTSRYLIPKVKEYVGIDYSRSFVDFCKREFADKPNATIQYGDARDLNDLSDKSFDFVFFSFNGIDYVDLDGRKEILKELTRVLKDDGVLSFSFHNKGNLDNLYSFQFPRNPFKYLGEWMRMKKVKEINGDKENYLHKEWFIIKDGGENFTLDTYYATPAHEQKLLKELGYKTFYFYDTVNGESMNMANAGRSQTPWIYITASR